LFNMRVTVIERRFQTRSLAGAPGHLNGNLAAPATRNGAGELYRQYREKDQPVHGPQYVAKIPHWTACQGWVDFAQITLGRESDCDPTAVRSYGSNACLNLHGHPRSLRAKRNAT